MFYYLSVCDVKKIILNTINFLIAACISLPILKNMV